jgi:hypothetical protein
LAIATISPVFIARIAGFVDRQARLLVDDLEHLGERQASRFLLTPSGQLARDRIQEGDARPCVSVRDHRVADARQGRREQLFLACERFLRRDDRGHVVQDRRRADDRPVSIADRRSW